MLHMMALCRPAVPAPDGGGNQPRGGGQDRALLRAKHLGGAGCRTRCPLHQRVLPLLREHQANNTHCIAWCAASIPQCPCLQCCCARRCRLLDVQCCCLAQVGVGVIFLEYRRTERNALDKKRKEDEFRQRLDDGVHRDREVTRMLSCCSACNLPAHPHLVCSLLCQALSLWVPSVKRHDHPIGTGCADWPRFCAGTAFRDAAVEGMHGCNAAAIGLYRAAVWRRQQWLQWREQWQAKPCKIHGFVLMKALLTVDTHYLSVSMH